MNYQITKIAAFCIMTLFFSKANASCLYNQNNFSYNKTNESNIKLNSQQRQDSLLKLDSTKTVGDSANFKGYLYNDEYKVYIDMNLYDNNIVVPRQEIFGECPGYFGAIRDTRKWIFSDAKIISPNKARLFIINDDGSDDLEAELYKNDDGTYTLERIDGNNMRIVVNRKWVKIPRKLTFEKTTVRRKPVYY